MPSGCCTWGLTLLFRLEGCIQAIECNKNTCPTGTTTHNQDLQRGFAPDDKAARVANYVRNREQEVGTIAHSCGVDEKDSLLDAMGACH